MRSLPNAIANRIGDRNLRRRSLLWITASNGGTPVSVGFWDDAGDVTIPVTDYATGQTVQRLYHGAGSLIGIDDIPLVADLTVREVSVTLSQIDASVVNAVRGYDCRLAPVEIHHAWQDPASRVMLGPALPMFAGVVGEITITDPQAGEAGKIVARLVSQSREMTRANPDMRSDQSQRLRTSGDKGYEHAGVCGEWDIPWGSARNRR